MSAPAQSQALPGQYFDVPGAPGGGTQWTEQDDTTQNAVQVAASGASTPMQTIIAYKQTDVVSDWFLCLNVTQTYVTGTSVLTASAYAPYNVIGPVRQLIQNQYASIDVESGIDLYIFNMIRPFRNAQILAGSNVYQNPAGDPVGGTATGYLTTALAQVNNINAAPWTTATTAYNLFLRLPAAQWFDRYYDLTVDGNPVTQPHPALVSPQYMAGTTRVVTPLITIAQGNAATLDQGPVNIGAGSGTYAGSVTARLRRRATYAGNPASQPPVYAWQYRQKTQRFGIGGQSRADLIVPLDTGQLLSVYIRMFDPLAAAALGAPINVNVVTRYNVQYGSGLLAFDAQTIGGTNAASIVQERWLNQGHSLLPAGVLALDLALDERNQMTNARALNTMTTAGILVHVEFTVAQSAAAYIVMGTESLVYVT